MPLRIGRNVGQGVALAALDGVMMRTVGIWVFGLLASGIIGGLVNVVRSACTRTATGPRAEQRLLVFRLFRRGICVRLPATMAGRHPQDRLNSISGQGVARIRPHAWSPLMPHRLGLATPSQIGLKTPYQPSDAR